MATPSRAGGEGLLTLPTAVHALYPAAQGWRHTLLGLLREPVDVASIAKGFKPAELDLMARWGTRRVVAATEGAIEALFGDRMSRTWPLATWACPLPHLRERTHFGLCLS